MIYETIKIINKIGDEATLADAMIGFQYTASFHEKGSISAAGSTCIHDTLCFTDDVGDLVSIWTHDKTFQYM